MISGVKDNSKDTEVLYTFTQTELPGYLINIIPTYILYQKKIIDIMGFNNINIHCNIISGAKDKGKDTDILFTFDLTEPPGYLINIIPTNILYQNVTRDRMEYIEFHIKDEHRRLIDFNGNMLSFTLHLI